MKKSTLWAAVSIVLALQAMPAQALAPTPASGTLSLAKPELSFAGTTNAAANPVPGDLAYPCQLNLADCDQYALTIDLPADYATANPEARIRIKLVPEFTEDNYDVYLYDPATSAVVASGTTPAAGESFEVPAGQGVRTLRVDVVPFTAYLNSYTVTINLVTGGGGGGGDEGNDADADGVDGELDECPGTPAGVAADAKGCPGAAAAVVSDAARPRVVVADLDSGINPYHEFYYSRGTQVTQEVLAALNVPARNVVKLTRTGDLEADLAADAGFWNRVVRGERYHFVGTNIIGQSFAAPAERPLVPDALKSAHGVGTSASVFNANPDAILLFIEAGTALGSVESHAAAFKDDAVDIITTSYGFSVPNTGVPVPEFNTFDFTYEGVVTRGKLHFSSGGNGPGSTPQRAGAGPWWSIGVSGYNEKQDDAANGSNGREARSGNFPDFVSDFIQDVPYCMDCETGTELAPGTSFSTPRAAGLASRVLLEARQQLGHAGGIVTRDGQPVMVDAGGKRISNWFLRRALEQAAHVPQTLDYDPASLVLDELLYGPFAGLPVSPVGPWLQVAWGDLTTDPLRGVLPAALSHLGLDDTPRAKDTGFCEFQTKVIQARKAYWDEIASNIPAILGEQAPGAPAQDPFIWCASDLPEPLHPASNDPGNTTGGGEPSGPPQLCDPTGELGCISQVPGAGPAVQGAVDTAYNTLTGEGEPADPAIAVASCARSEHLDGGRSYHVTLTAPDGGVNSFQVLEPTGAIDCANPSKHPLMLQGHGYGGSRSTAGFASFRDAGYTVISIDQRGFGASSGTVRVMDPGFEGRNVKQIVDWAEDNLDYLSWRDESTGTFVARPAGVDVASVANGVNLVLGATGGSYGGGYQLMLLAGDEKKRLDAIQPDITWHDLRFSLNPGDTIKSQYDLLLFAAGEAASQGAGLQNHSEPNGQDEFIKEAFVRGSTTNEFPRQALDWFRYHSLSHWCGAAGLPTMPYKSYGADLVPMVDPLGGDNVPAPQADGRPGIGLLAVPQNPLTHFQGLSVRLTQGMADTLFNFNEAWWNAACLSAAGAEVSLYTHNSGHGLILPTPGDNVADFNGGRCSMNHNAWFDARLKPTSTPLPRNDVCFAIAPNDQVKMEFEQVLAPQPNGPGAAQPFVQRDVVASQVPNGLAALGSQMGGEPVVVELGTVEQPGILAGIPRLSVTVSSLAGLNEAACTAPTAQARLGCDSITLVGIGIARAGSTEPPTLVDDQLTPLRGLGLHDVDLVGIADRLAVGDKVSLVVYGQHLQYVTSYSRDVTIPAVDIAGTVKLPIYGANADGTANFASGQRVLSGGPALDSDGDGVADATDNCTLVANADQANLDQDAEGDACDADIDGDGVANAQDAFPRDPAESADTDGDSVGDNADNCVDVANAGQADADGDGIGDACEAGGDTTPDAFSFIERTGVATSVYVTSETITLGGFDAPAAITIDAGQYRVNGGAWTSAAGTFTPGDTLAVRHVSAAAPSTATESRVTVGGTTGVFRSVTAATDRTPDAFGFATQTGVAPGAVVESDSVTPTGYNTGVAITAAPGAEYRVGTGSWTTAAGTLQPGESIQVRHTATTTAGGYTKTYVKVGGVTGNFTTRTR